MSMWDWIPWIFHPQLSILQFGLHDLLWEFRKWPIFSRLFLVLYGKLKDSVNSQTTNVESNWTSGCGDSHVTSFDGQIFHTKRLMALIRKDLSVPPTPLTNFRSGFKSHQNSPVSYWRWLSPLSSMRLWSAFSMVILSSKLRWSDMELPCHAW